MGGNASSETCALPCGAGDDHPWALDTGIIHELLLEERARNHIRWDSGAANQNWAPIVQVEGNYQRRRVHTFSPVRASSLRVLIRATNGDRSARLYEVRVYNESDKRGDHRD